MRDVPQRWLRGWSSESVLLIGFGVFESCKDGFAGSAHLRIRVGAEIISRYDPQVGLPTEYKNPMPSNKKGTAQPHMYSSRLGGAKRSRSRKGQEATRVDPRPTLAATALWWLSYRGWPEQEGQ